MKNWFISVGEQVTGPFDTEQLRGELEGGSLPGACAIWGKGQADWLPAAKWLHMQSHTEAKTKIESGKDWHYAVEGASKGPVSRTDLLSAIRNIKNKDTVLVWTKGMKAWADLYELEDLRAELGLERRESPRIPLSGSVVINFEDGESFTANLKSIASGGFGIYGDHKNLQNGVQVTLHITSDYFIEPIHAKAEAQYVTEAGYAGFRFLQISDEARSQITSFINSRKVVVKKAA